jgi:hypothetical protein
MTDAAHEATRERDFRWLRRHGIAYLLVIGSLLAINVLTFAGRLWAFWPAFGWGVVLLVHYLFVRSIHVEDEWVEERAGDLRMKSYDFDHIHNIQGRFADGSLDRPPAQSEDPDER